VFDDLTDKHRKKLKTSFAKDDFFKTNYFVIFVNFILRKIDIREET